NSPELGEIFQLKDGALKKHITAYYKEIYPSLVLILCRDVEIIQQFLLMFLQIESQLIHYDWGHMGIKTREGAKADGQVDSLVPHLKAANLNYSVSIFCCKKGGLRITDWKMIEENLAMFMLSFFEVPKGDGIWQSIFVFNLGSFVLGNGEQIRFWEDVDTVADYSN
ncbi:hypothetical protein ACJX0J_030594, partial [Zea mays]